MFKTTYLLTQQVKSDVPQGSILALLFFVLCFLQLDRLTFLAYFLSVYLACSRLHDGNRPIRPTQCCTQFKPFGNETFYIRNFQYHLNVNASLWCKYSTQRILSPGDLTWVQHWVSRIGLRAEIVKIEALNARWLGRNKPAESLSLPLFLPPPPFPDHARPFFLPPCKLWGNKKLNRSFAGWRHFTTKTRIIFVFAQESKILKDSGLCGRMTSSCN